LRLEDIPASYTYIRYGNSQTSASQPPAFTVSAFSAQNQTRGFYYGQYSIGIHNVFCFAHHSEHSILLLSDSGFLSLHVKTPLYLHASRGTAYTSGGVYEPSALTLPSKDAVQTQARFRKGKELF